MVAVCVCVCVCVRVCVVLPFLTLTFTTTPGVHEPRQSPDHYVEPYKTSITDTGRQVFAGMLAAVDEGMENVVSLMIVSHYHVVRERSEAVEPLMINIKGVDHTPPLPSAASTAKIVP